MSDTFLPDLNEVTNLAEDDLLHVHRASATNDADKKIKIQNLNIPNKLGKITRSLNNNISAGDLTITLDVSPQIGDRYIISWHSGDGTYQLIVSPSGSDIIKSGYTALNSTARSRFGEGEGSAVLEYVDTNVWLITSYCDRIVGSSSRFGDKSITGQLVNRQANKTIGTSTAVPVIVPFVNTEYCLYGTAQGAVARTLMVDTKTVTSVTLSIYDPAGAASYANVDWTAIGRWF
jgi:hypothetical protein